MALSPDELQELQEIQDFVKEEKGTKRRLQTHLYESVSAPLLENNVARGANRVFFHSILGRTALFAMMTFNSSTLRSLEYLFSLRLNALIEYAFTLVSATMSDMVLVTALVFTILIVFSIFTSIQQKAIMERMGGTDDIVEDTEEDVAYKEKHYSV